jgi:hypothetical protein
MCGDWHTAEDLAQTALAKVFVSWRKVGRRDAHVHATRTLVNSHLADKRLRHHTEILTGQLPDCRPVLQINFFGFTPLPGCRTDPVESRRGRLLAVLIAIAQPARAPSGHIGLLPVQLERTSGPAQTRPATDQPSLTRERSRCAT